MTELRECLRLDLPDPLSGEMELAAHLLQRPVVAVQQPEPELDDLFLPLRKRVEDRLELLVEEDGRRGVDGHHRVGVLDEVPEVGVLLLADGGLQRERIPRYPEDFSDPLGRYLKLLADLLGQGLAPEALPEVRLGSAKLVDEL